MITSKLAPGQCHELALMREVPQSARTTANNWTESIKTQIIWDDLVENCDDDHQN
jgi:hypothetical protein